ncbi:hypothetical protein Tph_c27270 [Thermacetogenium phaeum DSM 12270]|uniref:Uncharacterized protein n=1 Tax=Thermacetogenium phaeum (strain ATCC BAA-254 / DSM 26808 / PB) TaxID=1089553 RepID=K4LLD9_THEPS|nr:hypothetical protein Tph_c27270 [Thermacetogenium phaeum DSM 12270]
MSKAGSQATPYNLTPPCIDVILMVLPQAVRVSGSDRVYREKCNSGFLKSQRSLDRIRQKKFPGCLSFRPEGKTTQVWEKECENTGKLFFHLKVHLPPDKPGAPAAAATAGTVAPETTWQDNGTDPVGHRAPLIMRRLKKPGCGNRTPASERFCRSLLSALGGAPVSRYTLSVRPP